MKGNFRSLFRRFCLEGSISVMKYFYLYPDKLSRCFWSTIMVSMLGFALYLSYQLYTRFADMPTRITIENQYEPIRALPFPAVTICTPNQITYSAVSHFTKTLVNGNTTAADVQRIIVQVLGFYETILYFDTVAAHQLQVLINQNRYSISEVITMLPQPCEDFLQFCQLGRKRYQKCESLFKPILTTHGLCCAFNSKYYFNKAKKRNEFQPNFESYLASSSSLNNALTVVVDYKPDDAVDGTVLNAGGIRVLFTDYTEFPADDVSNMVLANTESFHLIQATYTYCSEDVKQLPESSRKCYFKNERHLPYFKEYHNSDCDHLCVVQLVRAACGCELFHTPMLHTAHACNVSNIHCITRTKLQQSVMQAIEECMCLRDCESRRYAVDMSIGNLDAVPYMINNIYSGIKFNKSTAIMHFFFPNSVYVKQKQETVISVITLASNLGGVFGLCVGCSAMTIVEIAFYIYSAFINRFQERVRRIKSKVMPLK